MEDKDTFVESPYTFDAHDWQEPIRLEWKRTKYRGYQKAGHKEKVIASRRRKDKASKQARKKNRR